MSTKIEWTNETWNPIIGCTKISEGCTNCYAEKFAHRLASKALKDDSSEYFDYSGIGAYAMVTLDGKWNGKTQIVPKALEKPLHWKKPRMIFVCSMGDLFHESIPFEWIDQVMEIIAMCPQHTFQVLTKRPKRMLEYFDNEPGWTTVADEYPLPNLWLGVTVENQKHKNRILDLLKCRAKIRFVSCEPLLSEINLYPFLDEYIGPSETMHYDWLNGLNWVIAGPETGPGKRPMKKEWIELLYNQCQHYKVPFFDKKNILGKNIQQYPNG